MTENIFKSSDSVRGAEPLRHAKSVTLDKPLRLELNGGRLPGVTVIYETYGKLNKAKDNAILICHAISGDSHVARHDESDEAGWWDIAVGPGKAIDTDKFFVICPNILGGCRGTTGPNSINPETNKPYGRDFPLITVDDIVEVQKRLLDNLGIEKLLSVVGGSMGGHQALCWAKNYSAKIRSVIPLATSPRLNSQALAFDVVGRNAIIRDPNFCNGQYYDEGPGPDVGLGLARMIGHITYLSREAMQDKFEVDRHAPKDVSTDYEKRFSVGSYLGYQADKFVERFDANSYIALSTAMDIFDLGGSPQEMTQALEKADCHWLIVSYTSDWLFPPDQSKEIVDVLVAANKSVSYCNVKSDFGHDAFLLPNDIDSYGELIRAFLSNVNGDEESPQFHEEAKQPHGHEPTSIFHPEHRLDYDLIIKLIDPEASVLDLGCGNGGLLARLKHNGHRRILGLEIDEKYVLRCLQGGIDVIHTDLNRGLSSFADNQFDVVVLSRTLQTVLDVEGVVEDMLRVGKQCIISFPNFAYYKLIDDLVENGRAPEAAGILRYKWFNTPNLRVLSIADFEDFCKERDIKVHRRLALDTEEQKEVKKDPNRNADLAIFVISR